MNSLKIIAFTHKTTDINDIGKFHVDESELQARLQHLKSSVNAIELLYLSTCNRVEFVFSSSYSLDTSYLTNFIKAFNCNWGEDEIEWYLKNAQVFEGDNALRHLFSVASSIDSLVVGEREIITQVRNAYEKCNELGLTGDLIRLVVKRTIEVAKEVYTHTNIAKNPVSVHLAAPQ